MGVNTDYVTRLRGKRGQRPIVVKFNLLCEI